jgi:hypothetical protein
MSRVKASVFHVPKVLDKNRLVDNSAVTFWLEVLHAVEVGNIDSSSIGRRTILTVFVDVHGKE